jgi:hypothetical protein
MRYGDMEPTSHPMSPCVTPTMDCVEARRGREEISEPIAKPMAPRVSWKTMDLRH